jgi:hypothetical protein
MSVTLNGTVYNDSDFAGLGYVSLFPEQVMSDFLAQADIEIQSIAALVTTSSTSVAIGSGSKTFVLAADKPFKPGMFVLASDTSTPTTRWMTGQVTAYTPGTKTLVFTVTTPTGTGTRSSWNIAATGERGPSGSGLPSISAGDALKIARVNNAETDYETVIPIEARGRYVSKSGAYTAVDGDYLSCNTASVAFTITLPASPSAGEEIRFVDENGTFTANNLTIARNGSTIMGLSEDLTCNTNNITFGLAYIGADWRIV